MNERLCFVFIFSIFPTTLVLEPVKEKEARATFFHLPQTKFYKISVREHQSVESKHMERTKKKIESKLNFLKSLNLGKIRASTGVNPSSRPLIPIFKGEKYHLWSLKMQTPFKSQELWEW